MNPPFADALLGTYVSRKARVSPVRDISGLQLEKIRRVLLVLTTGLGDAILSTAAFPSLRAALPNAEITLFCRSAWAPLFRSDPGIDSVVEYPGKYRLFFQTIRKMQRFAPDLVVILHGNDPDILPLSYLTGSPYIVRIPTSGTRFPYLLSNASRAVDRETLPNLHYIENRLRVLETLGIKTVSDAPRVYLADQTRRASSVLVKKELGDRPYWIYHSRPADPYKGWPIAKARRLLERATVAWPGYAVALTGSKQDTGELNDLALALPDVHNFAGVLDISGTAALIAGARCVVVPDTGIGHLAGALDVPVIALFAPTSAQLTGPRNRTRISTVIQKARTCSPCVEKRCPYTPANCMDQIGVDEVLEALSYNLK